ncbi:MAG: trypsin-like peptidase domain-containing protein [Phycisphaeraceae bacterium]|nr:trypsin-like peptidase domain-containing protein [Phycisphaeraceae bacterium]
MRRFVSFGPALIVLITCLATLVAAPAAVRAIGYADTSAKVRLARQSIDSDDILERINRSVRAIAEATSPSVVHIGTATPGRRGMMRVSQGSGWVYDANGHIVTNAHVVRESRQVFVQFQDGRQVDAEVVGWDRTTDIAVLRVATTEGLVPSERATGERLRQGDRVFAFGSPFGFKFSMSEGIVSGLGRDPRTVIGQDGYTNFIQTDAAVNPGNSGGPLVDVRGRVVGMNVAIATGINSDGTTEGQNSGISFAIPLETIESVVHQLITRGVVVKGFLGINHPSTDDVNRYALNALGYRGLGVVATQVVSEGPAASAGLRPNDVIVAFNGEPVISVPALRSMISNTAAGAEVVIDVWRDGTNLSIRPTLANLPPTSIELQEALAVLRGFGIQNLGETREGAVMITEVMPRSAAARAGFRPGQTIAEVNGAPIANIEAMLSALAKGGLPQGRDAELRVSDPDEHANTRTLTIPARR